MLSIIVSWRDRQELRNTARLLLAAAERARGDLTIVNYGGNEPTLMSYWEGLEPGPWQILTISNEPYFHKARAQNLGAAVSQQPILFFCDCDILLTEPELIVGVAREVHDKPGIFATLAGVVESEKNSRQAGNVVCFGYELDIRLQNGRRLKIVDNEEDVERGTRQAPGLLLVRRTDFLEIGGYNGHLHGWGWEDQDMIARLTLGAGLTRIQRGVVTHLSHGDHERIVNYPAVKDRWESRDRMFRQALANYDADDFAGTYIADNAQFSKRTRGPHIQTHPPGDAI